jgi:hypothetical protein
MVFDNVTDNAKLPGRAVPRPRSSGTVVACMRVNCESTQSLFKLASWPSNLPYHVCGILSSHGNGIVPPSLQVEFVICL